MQQDHRSIVAAGVLALGLVIAAAMVAGAVGGLAERDRVVEVKGFAERLVDADLAVWPIKYSVGADTLEDLRALLDRADASVTAFLKLHGFDDEEITRNPPWVNDRWLNVYDNQRPSQRYLAERTITLRSNKVGAVREAMSQAADLLDQGIALMQDWSGQGEFVFTSLESIKPEMIAEATADARQAAAQFAADSGSEVGAIRRARQGFFSIEDRDSSSPHVKKVRVVTTIEYALE
ncbi:MAG: SIMPL domain-containing protein [Wenzhouxiangellaceae bacterium]